MAFPTIQTADTKTGTVTSNSTSWTLTYPTNIAAGDLLICFVAADGIPHVTFPAGWIQANDAGAGAVTSITAKKKATGSETGTFTMALGGGATEQGAWRIFRIAAANWGGTIGTTFDGTAATTGDVAHGIFVQGVTTNPDPPNCAPVGWTSADLLVFAGCSLDTSRTISAYPYASNNTADVSGGSTGATLGLCTSNVTAASVNPGTFTQSASDDACAVTVLVRPASGSNFTQNCSGSVTPAGAVGKAATLPKAGSTTGSGALTRSITTTKAGSTTPAGAPAKLVTPAVKTGSSTPSGAVVRGAQLAKAGSVTGAGAISQRNVTTSKAGSSTPAGNKQSAVSRQLAGSATPSGSVFVSFLYQIFPAALIVVSGAIANLVSLVKGGSSTPAGAVTKSATKSAAGTSSPAGVLARAASVF
jgi:hypothetical protein